MILNNVGGCCQTSVINFSSEILSLTAESGNKQVAREVMEGTENFCLVSVWDSHYSDFFISHKPSTSGSWITGWATAPRRWSHCEGYLLNQHTFYRLQSQPIKHSFFFSLPLSWTAVWKWLLLFLAVHIPLLWVKQLSWAFKDLSASSAGLSIRAQTSHSCSSGSALRLSSAQWGNFPPLNCILLQLF